MSETKQPLLSEPMRLFLATMILANIAGQMHFGLLPLYLQSLGAGIEQVGLFFTLAAIVPLMLQIFGGWLSDALGRLQAIALGSLTAVLSYGVFIVAPRWEWLLLASILGAITRSFVAPSFQAFIAEQSSEENRGRVYGISEGLFSVVGVVGPPLGGFLSQRYGFKPMYAVAGMMYLVAAAVRVGMALAAMRGEDRRPAPHLAGLKDSLGQMIGLLAGGGVVTWIFITDGLRDVAVNMEEQLRPLYMQNLMGITNTQIGLLMSIAWLITMLMMGVGGWLSDKKGERIGIIAGLLTVAAGQGVFLISRGFWGFAVAWGLFGLGWALVNPAYNSLISKAVPGRLRGTAFGLFSTSIGVIALPAPAIGAWLWATFAPRVPFIVLPLALLASLPIIWLKFRLPAPEAEQGVHECR